MIFVIAAIFILVVSFVIALVSLIKEQSKIEKENVSFGKNQSQPGLETQQVANQHLPQPDLTNIGTIKPQPLPEPQPQPQTTASSPNYNEMPIKEKPWWEKEIQKRGEEPQGRTIDWQNTSKAQHVPVGGIIKIEESGEVLESQDKDLQGSFSVSDLTKLDQES